MAFTEASLRQMLEETLREILELPDSHPMDGVSLLSEPKWDSLATVSLIAAIESALSIRLDSADYDSLTSFNSTLLLLKEKLGL